MEKIFIFHCKSVKIERSFDYSYQDPMGRYYQGGWGRRAISWNPNLLAFYKSRKFILLAFRKGEKDSAYRRIDSTK